MSHNKGYGELKYIAPLQGGGYYFPSRYEGGNWIFKSDLCSTEEHNGQISQSRGQGLIASYEAKKFDWGKFGHRGRPSFPLKPQVIRGSGWQLSITEIVAEWDGEIEAELIEIAIDLNRGWEQSGLLFSKQFINPCTEMMLEYKRKSRRLEGFMRFCSPSAEWFSESGSSVQDMMNNRPEFGVTEPLRLFSPEMASEIYRISGEIAAELVR